MLSFPLSPSSLNFQFSAIVFPMGNETEEKADLRLLYQCSVSDIAFFKKQQWKVTNYGLLLYAVIVAVPKILRRELFGYEYIVLFLIADLIYIAGLYVLISLDESLKKSRKRLIAAKHRMSPSFIEIWRADSDYQEPEKKESLLWVFISVMTMGLVFVAWLFYQMAFLKPALTAGL